MVTRYVRPAEIAAPEFLKINPDMTPWQTATEVATRGVGAEAGGYRSDPAREFFKNIVARRLLTPDGRVQAGEYHNLIRPIEEQFMRDTLGLSFESGNINSVLSALGVPVASQAVQRQAAPGTLGTPGDTGGRDPGLEAASLGDLGGGVGRGGIGGAPGRGEFGDPGIADKFDEMAEDFDVNKAIDLAQLGLSVTPAAPLNPVIDAIQSFFDDDEEDEEQPLEQPPLSPIGAAALANQSMLGAAEGPSAASPAPGVGGPTATSPAGGTQAAGGFAPGTGTRAGAKKAIGSGDAGQSPGEQSLSQSFRSGSRGGDYHDPEPGQSPGEQALSREFRGGDGGDAGSGSGGGGGGSGPGSAGGAPGGAQGQGMYDGGHVDHSTGEPGDVEDREIEVMAGEYVLSQPVVSALGQQALDFMNEKLKHPNADVISVLKQAARMVPAQNGGDVAVTNGSNRVEDAANGYRMNGNAEQALGRAFLEALNSSLRLAPGMDPVQALLGAAQMRDKFKGQEGYGSGGMVGYRTSNTRPNAGQSWGERTQYAAGGMVPIGSGTHSN